MIAIVNWLYYKLENCTNYWGATLIKGIGRGMLSPTILKEIKPTLMLTFNFNCLYFT